MKVIFREASCGLGHEVGTLLHDLGTSNGNVLNFFGNRYNSHFTDKKTETQREEVICPRSHRAPVSKPGLKLNSHDPWLWGPVRGRPGELSGAGVQRPGARTLELAYQSTPACTVF